MTQVNEDFNTFTKINVHKQWGIEDSPDNLSWTGDPSYHEEFYSCTNEYCYSYIDKTSIILDSWWLDLKVSSIEDNAKGYIWLIALGLNNVKGLKDASTKFLALYVIKSGTKFKLVLEEFSDAINLDSQSNTVELNLDTMYYLEIVYYEVENEPDYYCLHCNVFASADDRINIVGTVYNPENAIDFWDLPLNNANFVEYRYLYAANTWCDNTNYIAHLPNIDNLITSPDRGI